MERLSGNHHFLLGLLVTTLGGVIANDKLRTRGVCEKLKTLTINNSKNSAYVFLYKITMVFQDLQISTLEIWVSIRSTRWGP